MNSKRIIATLVLTFLLGSVPVAEAAVFDWRQSFIVQLQTILNNLREIQAEDGSWDFFSCYRLTQNLKWGMSDWNPRDRTFNEVEDLQLFLEDAGLFDITDRVNNEETLPGIFDLDTQKALLKFQALYELPKTGKVDTDTRAMMKKLSCQYDPEVQSSLSLELRWPLGGEVVAQDGSSYLIRWHSYGSPVVPGTINVGLFKNHQPLGWIAYNLPDTGFYWWQPDPKLAPGNDYSIGINASNLPNGDYTEEFFTIR